MAIFASSSTITTQTVPLITVDLAEVKSNYVLQWDGEIGSFVARSPLLSPIVDLADPSQVTGVLPISSGGTGNTSYEIGDLLVAKEVNGTVILDSIPLGTGTREQVLTIVDGNPEWENGYNIKSITSNRVSFFDINGGDIGDILPPNSVITKIKVIVDQPYTNSVLSVGTSADLGELLSDAETFINTSGIFVYDINELYTDPTQLIATITGTNDGSLQIIVDYIAI